MTDIVPIEDPASPSLAAIATLYVASFPESERKPAGFLTEAAGRDDYLLLRAGGDALAGMAVAYRSAALGFAMLEYMAVAPEARGGGLGARMFGEVVARHAGPVIFEVEAERPGTLGAALRARRIGFYRRLGCRTVEGFSYVMPRLAAEPPPPLELMVCGAMPDAATLCLWLGDIYANVYSRPLDDPELVAMQAVLRRGVTRY